MEKTCGNCGKFALEPFKQRSGACMGSFDRDTCTYHSTSIHRDESNCPWCSGWIPHRDPIEQSYQQLAEVALDMLESLDDTCRFCSHRECMQFGCSEAYNNAHNHFKAQLEELGVEL